MISNLEILNGNLELKFDPYNYIYTVKVDNDIDHLEFSYDLEKDYNVSIKDNVLNNEENIVYLDVYSIDEEVTYTFYVYKESDELISSINNYINSLEVTPKSNNIHSIQILVVSMFLILLISFSIIFKRKKN